MSDYELIQRCRKGDNRAWEAVLDQYGRLVFSIPLNAGLSPEDAADISQLTFTIFMQSLDKLRDDSRLGSWLATVAKRHSWRLLARRRRERVELDDDLASKSQAQAPNLTERWERIEWLTYGLNHIDERCRTLLLALYFDPQEPSYAEIATDLNISVGSVGPTRARCLKKLKKILTST